MAPFNDQHDWDAVLEALLETPDPPTNYGLTSRGVLTVAGCYDWDTQWVESGWAPGTVWYDDLPAMVRAEPDRFLADISRYYGDDYYRNPDPPEED